MIRNIVFDMGNVLIRFDPGYFLTREGIETPEDREILMRELFLSLEWAQMDRGDLREETAEPLILSRIPDRLKETARRLLYNWADPRDVIEGMEDLVRRLKAAGYGTYLLSNASVRQHQYWPKYAVSRLMDGKLISCDVHTVKPCREIYEAFTGKFGLKGEACLFIDDAAMNVAGAVACGWDGIVFHGSAKELEERLREKGVFC
jgi:putative hydrolase of the HAD superfamily